MAVKTAFFSQNGYMIQPGEQSPTQLANTAVELAIAAPEPLDGIPSELAHQPIEDDPNTSDIDESMPLTEIRHKQYEVEQRRRWFKWLKWGVILFGLSLIVFAGLIVHDLRKVTKQVNLSLKEASVLNDESNERIILEDLSVDINLPYQGFFKTYLSKGIDYQIDSDVRVSLITRHSWYNLRSSKYCIASAQIDKIEDRFKVINGTYTLELERLNVTLSDEGNLLLNDLMGSKQKADILIQTKLNIWNGFTIPIWSYQTIEKKSIDPIVKQLVNHMIVSSYNVEDFNGDYIEGNAVIEIEPFSSFQLTGFKIPDVQLHSGLKTSSSKFHNLVTMEMNDFEFDKANTINAKLYPIPPAVNKKLQNLINSFQNEDDLNIWIRAGHCKDSWLCGILKGLEVEVSLDSPSMDFVDLTKFSVDSLACQLNSESDALTLRSQTEILHFNPNVPFDGTVSGYITMNGLGLFLNDGIKLSNAGKNLTVVDTNDIKLKVKNEKEVLHLIDSLLNNDEPVIDIDLKLDALINSKMLNGTFHLDFKHSFPSLSPLNTTAIPYDAFDYDILSIEVIEESEDSLILLSNINITNPFNINIVNSVDEINFDFLTNVQIGRVSILPFTLIAQESNVLQFAFSLKDESPVAKHQVEEFIGEFISSESLEFKVQGHEVYQNKPFTSLLSQISHNVKIKNDTISVTDDFILETTMHLFSKSVELTLFDPIEDLELDVCILEAHANYEGELLGELPEPQHLKLTQGINHSPLIPVEYSDSSAGWKVVREALKSGKYVPVDTEVLMHVNIGRYPMDLYYKGKQMLSKIRI